MRRWLWAGAVALALLVAASFVDRRLAAVLAVIAVSAAAAIAAWLLVRVRRAQLAKSAHPEDYAFYVSRTFRSDHLHPRERLRDEFPDAEDELIHGWLADFDAVDAEIARLSEAGGPPLLGETWIRGALQDRFPFLVERGLQLAVSRVGYYTAHEGYDKLPIRSVESVQQRHRADGAS